MGMPHTWARALGGAALAASLTMTGAAVAAPSPAERVLESRTDSTPSYRLAVPSGEPGPPTLAGPSRRDIFSEVVWRDQKLYLRGDVEDYFRRTVTVQRSACDTCRWRRHDVVNTGRRGWFKAVIRAPKNGSTFWRAKVSASDGYGRSYSATWETYY